MKKLYEVVILKRDERSGDEWQEMLTYDKEEAIKRAIHESGRCYKPYYVELREYNAPDDFDYEVYLDVLNGDHSMDDMGDEVFACYDTIEF